MRGTTRPDDSARSAPRTYDLVHGILVRVAPEEVPMLERLHSLDDAAIAKRFATSERDDPLGFGLEDVVPLLVVALWPVVEGALSDLLAEDLKKVRGRAWRVVRKWRRSRRIRRADRPALSTVQVRRLRTAVEEAAQELGMSAEDTADLVGRVMEGLKGDPGTDSDERTS